MTEASLHFGQLILKGPFGMASAGNSFEKPHLGHVTAIFSIYLLDRIDVCCIIYEKSLKFKHFSHYFKKAGGLMDSKLSLSVDKGLAGQVMNIEGLVSYQEGAVVSKTLLNKKAGTITLFAFDKGQGLSEHTAPYDATVQIVDGEAEITISGKVQTAKKGEMLIMPANEPHSLLSVERFKMVLIMIRSA
jgi:quercetin dioxygenase-like cupin family protein